MSLKHWVLKQEKEWTRLEELLEQSQASVQQLSPAEIRELGLMYRSTINDLSRVRSSKEHQHLTPYLNNLVQRVHAKVYEKPPTRLNDIFAFFFIKFPQCVRKNGWIIFLAFFTFALGSVLSMLTVHLDPSTSAFFLPPSVIDQVAEGKLWMDNINAGTSKSSMLMTNNIQVAFKAYVGGLFFGIGSLFVLFFNGLFAFGGPLQICIQYGMGDELMLFMLPHGIIELTTIFISGGAGMIIGLALLFPGDKPRWQHVRDKAGESFVLIAGCIFLLIIAGIIEGMVSLNNDVPAIVRIFIASSSAVLLFSYLFLSGRTPKKENLKQN